MSFYAKQIVRTLVDLYERGEDADRLLKKAEELVLEAEARGRAAGLAEAAKYIDDYSTGMGDEIRQLVTLGSQLKEKD